MRERIPDLAQAVELLYERETLLVHAKEPKDLPECRDLRDQVEAIEHRLDEEPVLIRREEVDDRLVEVGLGVDHVRQEPATGGLDLGVSRLAPRSRSPHVAHRPEVRARPGCRTEYSRAPHGVGGPPRLDGRRGPDDRRLPSPQLASKRDHQADLVSAASIGWRALMNCRAVV